MSWMDIIKAFVLLGGMAAMGFGFVWLNSLFFNRRR